MNSIILYGHLYPFSVTKAMVNTYCRKAFYSCQDVVPQILGEMLDEAKKSK